MKSFEEAYAEVMASDKLKECFAAAQSPANIAALAEELGVEAAPEEIIAFLRERLAGNADLSEDDLDQVAGDKSTADDEIAMSIMSFGVGCFIEVCVSLNKGNVGTAIEGEGMLMRCLMPSGKASSGMGCAAEAPASAHAANRAAGR